MRTSGPPKKPTALKVRTGNPGRHRLPKNEPKPDEANTACPAWLKGTARAKWKTLAPHLKKLGLLTVLDLDQLAVYCRAYAEYRHAEAEIAKLNGALTIASRQGTSIGTPASRFRPGPTRGCSRGWAPLAPVSLRPDRRASRTP